MLGRDPQDLVARMREYPFWIGEPDHIAATAVFLASDAARRITGATILRTAGARPTEDPTTNTGRIVS